MSILKTFAIFAKFWESGKVKTRLARSIGDLLAAKIYRQCLEASIHLVDGWQGQKVLGFSPPERHAAFGELASEWRLLPQVDADLGTRMKTFFDQVLRPGSQTNLKPSHAGLPDNPNGHRDHHLVLIGSDTPLLPPHIIEEAYQGLADHDVVIGPSCDGGYYLIGARNLTPGIFEGVRWSSEQVFSQTVQHLEDRGYAYHVLEPYRDLDDLDDLKWIIEQLSSLRNPGSIETKLLSLSRSALDDSLPDSRGTGQECLPELPKEPT